MCPCINARNPAAFRAAQFPGGLHPLLKNRARKVALGLDRAHPQSLLHDGSPFAASWYPRWSNQATTKLPAFYRSPGPFRAKASIACRLIPGTSPGAEVPGRDCIDLATALAYRMTAPVSLSHTLGTGGMTLSASAPRVAQNAAYSETFSSSSSTVNPKALAEAASSPASIDRTSFAFIPNSYILRN